MFQNKRRGKKNKLEEVQKPRGLDRNLELEAIVGASSGPTNYLMFLVKWIDCDDLDLVPAKELNKSHPDRVIEYYEARSTIFKKLKEKKRVFAEGGGIKMAHLVPEIEMGVQVEETEPEDVPLELPVEAAHEEIQEME